MLNIQTPCAEVCSDPPQFVIPKYGKWDFALNLPLFASCPPNPALFQGSFCFVYVHTTGQQVVSKYYSVHPPSPSHTPAPAAIPQPTDTLSCSSGKAQHSGSKYMRNVRINLWLPGAVRTRVGEDTEDKSYSQSYWRMLQDSTNQSGSR